MSSLPLTVNGSASRTTTAAGTMYGGSRSASAVRARPGRMPRRRLGDIADQALVAGAVLAGDHHRLLDPVQPGQRRLDLAEFDAIPADLDLLIGAPQILQLPVGAPPHQIPGAIHPRPGLPERACHKPRRGQPGPAHIPIRHARRRPHTAHRPPRPAPGATTRPARTTPPRAPAQPIGTPRPRCQRRTDGHTHRGLGRAVGVDHHPPGRPPIHHLGRAGLTGHHQRRRLQTLAAITPATADGVWVSTLTCSATSKAWKSSGEPATASGTTTSRPPRNSAPKISHTETSNANV